jgi:hypothetical protein
MDDPESSQSYETQFVQLEDYLKDETTTLRQAVMEMKSSGSGTKVVQAITGFIMSQMSAKAGIKKHEIFFTKIMKAPYVLKRTAESHVDLTPGTLTYGISGSRTDSALRTYKSFTVPQNRCWRIVLQNHYREAFSKS